MRYMFRVLVLGDPLLSLPFVINSGVDHVSQDAELSRWSKSINIGTDQADLEIDVVVTTSTDFDSIIPTSDGILYFLDPNSESDFELFDMISHIIQQVNRELPIIVVFNTRSGFIKIPANYLLEYIWDHYPFEAFFFNQFSKNTLYEVLECLCESMIGGSMPINIETAWIRLPFFIRKINSLVVQEKYEQAARLTEILTQIKKKFNLNDAFITAEQSSWLYSKIQSYLKASSVIEGVNDEDSGKFRKLYVENMISEGNQLYKMKRFRNAAEKYEKAALWSAIELQNDAISKNALNFAINTWISACEFQNSFRLMEKLDHNETLEVMKSIAPKIAEAADFLIQNKKYDIVKSQLYSCIDKYQRSGLFDEVKLFGQKISIVLNILIHNEIQDNDPDSATITLDELLNIHETFELPAQNLDVQIKQICIQFLKKFDFNALDKLVPKIQSMEIQKEITDTRVKAEEDFKKSKKDIALADFQNAIIILEKYVRYEINQFEADNKKALEFIEGLKKDNQIWNASLVLKQRSQWYKKIGHKILSDDVLEHVLDLYIEGDFLAPFVQEINNLSNEVRPQYLRRTSGRILNAIERLIGRKEPTDKVKTILENINRLYRNHLLYDESKDVTKQNIKFVIGRANDILFQSSGLDDIPMVLSLLKEADLLYESLSEKEKLNYDPILEEIVKRYIKVEDLSKAALINEKILNKAIFSELHNQILKIEEKRSGEQIKDVQKTVNWRIKAEELSNLKNHSRDILMNQQSILKSRMALKRLVYGKMLDSLVAGDYTNALESCKQSTITQAKQRKLETGGIGLAIIAFILIKTNQMDKLASIIEEIDRELASGAKVFHETFAVRVVDYIKEMYDFKELNKAMDAVALLENLALFDEEKNLLFSILGKGVAKSEVSVPIAEPKSAAKTVGNAPVQSVSDVKTASNSADTGLVSGGVVSMINGLIGKLEGRKVILGKRKMMQRKYWDNAVNLLSNQSYKDAANDYFVSAKNVLNDDHEEFFPVSLTIGVICLIKSNQYDEAKRRLEKAVADYGNTQEIIQKMPEYLLLEKLIESKEKGNEVQAGQILEGFITNLALFDIEKSLLLNISNKEVTTRVAEVESKDKIQKSQSAMLLNQQIANLRQGLGEVKSNAEKILQRRSAMRRIYYKDLLDKLAVQDFKSAAEQYSSIAVRLSQRNDYEIAGILMLLGGLSLMKAKTSIDGVRKYINTFLELLGFTRKVIEETFGIKLILFLIEARTIEDETLFNQGWIMLPTLQLFDEEKILIS